jgi:D-alanyl-D-alanine carboxypeptidase
MMNDKASAARIGAHLVREPSRSGRGAITRARPILPRSPATRWPTKSSGAWSHSREIVIEVRTARGVENSNLLIGTLEGATGVKTGWTSRAGYSLVGSAERGGIELFAVILGTPTRWTASSRPAAARVGVRPLRRAAGWPRPERCSAKVRRRDYLDRSVEAVVGVPANLPVFDLAGEVTRTVSVPESVDAPIARGDRLGTLSLVQGDRLIAQVPLIAIEDVKARPCPSGHG